MEVEREGASLAEFARHDNSPFQTLEAKLKKAVEGIAKGQIANKIMIQSKALANQRRSLSGRQMLLIVYQEYYTDKDMDPVHTLTALLHIKLFNDDLESFLTAWDDGLLATEQEPLPSYFLAGAFLSKIEFSTRLADDIKRYRRFPKGHPDKTYEYLYSCARSIILTDHQQKLRTAQIRSRHNRKIDRWSPTALTVQEENDDANALAATDTPGAKPKSTGGPPQRGRSPGGRNAHNSRSNSGGRDGNSGGDKGRQGSSDSNRACHQFFRDGTCSYGDQCKYSHDPR